MSFELIEFNGDDRARLEVVARMRLDVWRRETEVDESHFEDGKWIEPLDMAARHWIAVDGDVSLGAARLTMHETLADNPDGYLWIRAGIAVPTPAASLCKLVVIESARGQGIGRALNLARVAAARAAGARSVLVTASALNARLLSELGFVDTGLRETFPNRPRFEFHALQLICL